MENPLISIRKEKDLTRTELGLLCKVSHMTIRRIEDGSVQHIKKSVLDTVERMGYKRQQLIDDYEKWMAFRIKQLETKINE